jgi:hypothetical protein
MTDEINPIFDNDALEKKFVVMTEVKKFAYPNHYHLIISFDHKWKKDPIQVLAHHELPLHEVVNYIRMVAKIGSGDSIILFCKDHMPPVTHILDEIYYRYGKEKKLKFKCFRENTFG